MKKIVIFVVAIVLVLASAGVTIWVGGFGAGDDSKDGNQALSTFVEEIQDEKPEENIIIIKVEENKIYVEKEECADIGDLTDKISKISSQEKDTKYVFEHEYAIKATYDEVKKALLSLEATLGISIDYRE